ncbi:MAG TPA: pyridoxamine 5'-phosphate oxidase [Streptosporangiaceae bacterium]
METPEPAGLRQAYSDAALNEADVAADPFAQFGTWFADMIAGGLPEPNAMILATASAAAEPSARTVLLKGYGQDGFRFFTNHTSHKGRDLRDNPRACLVFPWHALHRQVVVTGGVSRLPEAETASYFHSRPHGSQLGAWASHQSSVIGSRAALEARYAELADRWPEEVPVPDFWGGYLLTPDTVEFWQGRADRLHDRLRFTRSESGWAVERLSP